MSAPKVRINYLTVSQVYRLHVACLPVRKTFGCAPYLVGSVLHRADYKDVDLRMPMWEARGGTDFRAAGERLLFLNCAISEWVAAASGLPIDFQFQDAAEWESHDGDERHPFGYPRLAESLSWSEVPGPSVGSEER